MRSPPAPLTRWEKGVLRFGIQRQKTIVYDGSEHMKFSVLMSIYHKEDVAYFHEAMESIWSNQTTKPSEIVLVKDGPLTPGLDKAIQLWESKLASILKIVQLDKNVGLGAALNEGLLHCSYELVARMDTDDISYPSRFEKQLALMVNRSDIAVSSGWIEEIDEAEKVFSIRKLPENPSDLLRFARKRSPIAHPVAIFRKSAILEVGGYPPLRKSQDYGLWAHLLVKGYKMANIQEPLLKMRLGNVFGSGRGFDHLKNEWAMFHYQKRIGFITWLAFAKNFAIRCVLRLSPVLIKRCLYRYGRSV